MRKGILDSIGCLASFLIIPSVLFLYTHCMLDFGLTSDKVIAVYIIATMSSAGIVLIAPAILKNEDS